MRRAAAAFVSFVVTVAAAVVFAPTASGPVGAQPAPFAGTCPTFEAEIPDVPAVANPFDPAEIEVQVSFTSPSGAVLTVDAFFTQDHTRELVNGRERLTPTGDGHWMVRFTPTEPGTWSWTVSTSVAGGPPSVSSASSFDCTADPASHGFLRTSPEDPRYLEWEDGTPYTAIGENLSWYDGRGTFAYDSWLDQLQQRGATWARLWMPSWAFGLETLTRNSSGVIVQNSLGNYTTRLGQAWQLDYVIEAARARGIVVQLVLQNHGPFSLSANTQWADNPYNAANGGPLTDPTQFFTNATAKELFERRMRYVVARWGHATNLVWEFWNEVDLVNAPPADVIAWHAEMGDELRALDVYDHLQTTSVNGGLLASPSTWVPLFALPQIDLTGLHFYGIGTVVPFDFTTLVPAFMAPLLALGKPTLLAEAGVDFRGPAETIAADPEGQGFHELLWTGLFVGGYGSGMTWWWDNVVDPLDQYDTFDGLVALTAGVALDEQGFQRDGAVATRNGGAPLQAFPLRGHDTTLVWVRNPDNWWFNPDLTLMEGATLRLEGLAPGDWRVEWVDPYTAETLDGGTVTADGTTTTITLPSFTRELALRLTLEQPRTAFLECARLAGTGRFNPSLTDELQTVALSLKRSTGGCSGSLVGTTGPLVGLTAKLTGAMSCDATVRDPLRPLAGKVTFVWTARDAKDRPLKSVSFVRARDDRSVPDALDLDNGIVVKGPGVGMDVDGGFLVQPTRNKVADVSGIDAKGDVMPGAGSLAIAAGCAAGTDTVDKVVFGTDGTSLLGAPFDRAISFNLPTLTSE